MNPQLQNLQDLFLGNQHLPQHDKDILLQAIKDVDRQLTIVEFKLDRTEKVKRTTAILLEETIDELEQKRKAVEDTNAALKKSMEELKATQKQLIHAEKMASLGELTAGIAHEIQNPLNFVNNFSEINTELIDELKEELEAGNLEEVKAIAGDLAQNEEKISHHGKRADGIVKSMLQHSKGGSGKMEPADLNALIRKYVNLTYHGMRAGNNPINVTIDLQLDDEIKTVPLVEEDFSRVLLNLCNNAFDAMRETAGQRPPKLTIRTKPESKYVLIEIEDNGTGIPEEIKDKILQPFFTTKKGTEGTGLGLSITNDIVKAHGGEILVRTKKNNGTAFTIRFPK